MPGNTQRPTGLAVLISVVLAVPALSRPEHTSACTVSGISVTTHWSGRNDNLFGGWGRIDLHTIEQGTVTGTRTVYVDSALFPVIDPRGTRVAFIARHNGGSACLAVYYIAEQCVRLLRATSWQTQQGGYVDWPQGRHIYFSKGGYSERGSSEIWRVDPRTPSKARRVLTFKTYGERKGGLIRVRQWLWSMSLDGARMTLRCTDNDLNSSKFGAILFLKVPATLPQELYLDREGNGINSHWVQGCQNAISASGGYICYGMTVDEHRAIRIKKWWHTAEGDDLARFDTEELHRWPSDRKDYGGEFNRTRWSNNSDEWICAMEGYGNRGARAANQVLYNWRHKCQIGVTRNKDKSYTFDSAGDFHIQEGE